MTTELKPETEQKTTRERFLYAQAKLLRDPGNVEHRIFHGLAHDDMKAESKEERERLAKELEALAAQPADAKNDRHDRLDESPREKLLRETGEGARLWQGRRERAFQDGTEPPDAA